MPDIVTSKTFVDGEKGITATKMNQIISGAVIQPAFYSAKPVSATLDAADQLLELKASGAYATITGAQIASSVAGQLALADATQNGMLRKLSGLSTDFVDGTNNCQNLASGPAITQMRLRSFNAIGNSNFEVDQANGGALAVTSPADGKRIADRWLWSRAGSHQVSTSADPSVWVVPLTNFRITSQALKITLTVPEATLAAADLMALTTIIEGPLLRELCNDVHSLQLLVQSSVAGLKFSVSLSTGSSCIIYLCTIPSANTPTLVTLLNIPVFPSGFSLAPGTVGYQLHIVLAAGPNYQASTLGAWQGGTNFISASAQDNFAGSPLNSTFTVAFIQHEPGPICTTPIDCPFAQNRDSCLRYFQKTYDYPTLVGAATYSGARAFQVPTGGNCVTPISFHKPMAIAPAVTGYSPVGGVNTLYDQVGTTNRIISGPINPGQTGFGGFSLTSFAAGPTNYHFHYTADTGW